MKLLSFTIITLVFVSSNISALEFHSCTDSSGKTHFTNLPKSSLDSNCNVVNHYSLLLNHDYSNLSEKHAKYKDTDPDDVEIIDNIKLGEIDLSADAVKNKFRDIFDPDKALNELMETTEDRDDIFTRAMRGRSKGIEDILEQEKGSISP